MPHHDLASIAAVLALERRLVRMGEECLRMVRPTRPDIIDFLFILALASTVFWLGSLTWVLWHFARRYW